MRFLKELRIRKAEDLLRRTSLSIKEITLLCGLQDVSHFVRDFKRKNGMTPTEFREQMDRRR